MQEKGQAAMEYLMTYGWALLVVVLVLGALIYLQVLNPQARLQDTCTLPIGWDCKVESLKGDGTLTLKITNQQPVQVVNVAVVYVLGSGTQNLEELFRGVDSKDSKTLSPGQSDLFTYKISGFGTNTKQVGDAVSGEVILRYKEAGSTVDKYLKGTFNAKVSIPASQ
ncbi:MAG: hypothetical protein ACP5KJ_01135 [Candidatus Micrarchaeia archaeon]